MEQIIYPSHFNFSYLPTPVISLKNLTAELSAYNLLVKRDDLSGIELSGNKIRKLDFLLKEAVEAGAQRVITCGGLQSNHCRATAYAALQCGLKTTLLLRGQKPDIANGNYLLSKISGAEIIFVTEEEYKTVDKRMEDYARESKDKVYVIPEGGSNATGAWGYVKCFFELQEQITAMNLKCDTVVVASGSGGTHAGLLIGKLLAKSPLNIISVNVCDDQAYFVNKIDKIISEFSGKYKKHIQWDKSSINIVDGFVGEGYGKTTGVEEEFIIDVARKEGFLLEPVYTAKAFRGMMELMKQAKFPGENIIFIHTGGIFGIFPYEREIQKRA